MVGPGWWVVFKKGTVSFFGSTPEDLTTGNITIFGQRNGHFNEECPVLYGLIQRWW